MSGSSHKLSCPTCAGTRDRRAFQCKNCRFKYNHPRKGTGAGRGISNGYVWVMHNNRGVYEHRLIMEQHLRRPLKTAEHVHHKNGNKQDNRLVNLELLVGKEHHRRHMLENGFAKRISKLAHAARWNA